jgi:hypothetical protein
MAKLVQQSTANDPLFFFLVLSSDHLSPATGKSPTVTISKNGAAFAAPSGAVTEIANGWYQVAGNATDTSDLACSQCSSRAREGFRSPPFQAAPDCPAPLARRRHDRFQRLA